MSKLSADQALVRELNLSLVLRLIHNKGPISRAKIAKKIGLNKSTVSSLVEDLLKRRLVHEAGIKTGTQAGRPARLLEINPLAGNIVGIEFGVDHISVGLSNFSGKLLWSRNESVNLETKKEVVLEQTLAIAQEAIQSSKDMGTDVFGIGVATPGTVNIDEGLLIFAPNLQWHNVPLRDFFKKNTGINVFVENDANSAAIAEKLFGVTKESENFIFIFAGVGIGGGLFLNGNLYRGHIGYAGEIGHSPIMAEPFEAPCHCGNRGCWETYANKLAIIRRAQSRLDARRESIIPSLMKQQNSSLSLAIIKEAADQGDKEAIESIQETGKAMALGVATLVSTLNPKQIVLGGPLSTVGDYLIPEMNKTLKERVLPEITPSVEILLSNFKDEAGLTGPISIVVDNILKQPSQIQRR